MHDVHRPEVKEKLPWTINIPIKSKSFLREGVSGKAVGTRKEEMRVNMGDVVYIRI
jgi:hypothetical protein